MGKINKHANLYNTDGELLKSVNIKNILTDFTIEELENMIDKLAEDKDENGKVKNPQALNNCNAVLIQMYQKYGNPHEKELLEKIKAGSKKKTSAEEVKQALEDVASTLRSGTETDTIDDGKDKDVSGDEHADDIHEMYEEWMKQSIKMDETLITKKLRRLHNDNG